MLLCAGRARNFGFAPDSGTLRMFRNFGFVEWLSRVKQDASVKITLQQLGEFVAWWKHEREDSKPSGLTVLVTVAKEEKHAPEEYNTFLHRKGFRPASILNRIDAICYALLFMRLSSSSCMFVCSCLCLCNVLYGHTGRNNPESKSATASTSWTAWMSFGRSSIS